jgi:hypothetical protein
MKKIYVVPVETKRPFEFFTVKKQQKLMTGHLVCGEYDEKTRKFTPFTKRSKATPPIPLPLKQLQRKPRQTGAKKKSSRPSLPIPN